MPRGLLRTDGAWIETEVTPEMFLDSKGRPWSCALVSNCGNDRFSHHRVMHHVVHNGITHMVITLVSVCRGFNIAQHEGTLVYAVDTNGRLIDYNPQNIVIPCMIPQMVQIPSLIVSGGRMGLHLRSAEVCREMRGRSTAYEYTSQITIWLKCGQGNSALGYGTLWFVVLSDRYTDGSSHVLDVADEYATHIMRDITLPQCGVGADIWERLPDAYIYIVYTVDSCIEDITHVPMVAALLAHLLSDEDAMVLTSHDR